MEISEPIWVTNSRVTISNLQIRVSDKANCPAIIVGTTNNRISNVTIFNIEIDGNRTNQSGELWKHNLRNNGIFVQNADNVTISNVVIRSCRSGGFVCERVNNLRVIHLISNDNHFDGLATYETINSVFENIALSKNQAAGISIDNSCKNNLFSDCIITLNDSILFMRNSDGNVFNQFLLNKNKHGIFISQVDDDPTTGCSNNTFSGIPQRFFRINNPSCTNNAILSLD